MSKSDLLELLRKVVSCELKITYWTSSTSLDKLVDDIKNALKQTDL